MNLNMEADGSSRTISRATKEPAYRRRVWSKQEEQVLVNALKEIVVTGWKCENMFRTGYLNILEKALHKVFPDTDIRAQPHIDSKVHVWRKHHSSLTTMLSRSGFGFDYEKFKIKVESKMLWDEYVKTDAHAKGMLGKEFPLYPAWQEIFGKERATGENAEDLEAANNAPLGSPDHNHMERSPPVEESPLDTDNEVMSVCGPSEKEATRSAGKKMKADCGAEGAIVQMMGKFCEQVDKRLGEISTRIGYEMRMCEKRAELFDAIGRLGVLNSTEQIYIHKVLSNNNKDLEAFFNMPEIARAQMVCMMCDGQI